MTCLFNCLYLFTFAYFIVPPPPYGGGIKRCICQTFCLCLSVAYIGLNSRTEKPRKTKIGTEVAHVTRVSDTIFKVKGQLVADVLNSQHAGTGATMRINRNILLCRNSTASWRCDRCEDIVNLQGAEAYCVATRTARAKILSTCRGRRHIVSPRAQLVCFYKTATEMMRSVTCFPR